MRHGKPAQISDFRVNDQLTATIITSKPPQVLTEREVQATLAGSGLPSGTPPGAARPAPKPTAPPPTATTPPTAAAPSPTGTTAPAAAPKKLPKTASPLPVLGLVGLAALVAGLGLTARRRRSTR